MISIQFRELVKKYEKILTSTSRGFDTKYEFLEAWVPSSEITQSVLDLINSALDYEIKELEILFDVSDFKELNFDKIKKKFPQNIKILTEEKKIILTG